ncbi:MAG: DUF3388 domain-containing protein [Alicyclobacillaceae bacterium]|nr:DUF3388 domain-containing protein [Alicyclobacillaceae bacterium]
MEDWYFEYDIQKNRPGLLGDISSLLGMLSINIQTINGVENVRRGMLIQTEDRQKISMLRQLLRHVDSIRVTALRQPTLIDRIALRHGRFIERESSDLKTYKFTREELGILVDFLGELLKRPGHQIIGVRGMPRVGKTESIVAASVYANKRWTFVSSTLIRQTVRTELSREEMDPAENVYIIDGIVSTMRADERHRQLVREVLRLDGPKVIEHPDIFVQRSEYGWDLFDRVIELRNSPDEEITYRDLPDHFTGFE